MLILIGKPVLLASTNTIIMTNLIAMIMLIPVKLHVSLLYTYYMGIILYILV